MITLDVLMPGLDGWSVLQALKADPALAPIPVVMLTILDEQNRGYALGAADYLTKPIQRDRLRSLLARHCGHAAGKQVLIVDDDPEARRWLARALTAEGWQTSEAEDGRAALDASPRASAGPDPAGSADAGDGWLRVPDPAAGRSVGARGCRSWS